jgi:hypothetical protein
VIHRTLSKVLGACVLAGFMSSAWSIPLSDLGSVDKLLASDKLANSGESTESAWASGILGFNVTFDTKINGSGAWSTVDSNPGLYAVDFGADGDDPLYYLVKTGAGSTTGPGDTHFLFQNLDSFRYGLINLGDLGFSSLMVGKISHTTIFDGGGGTSVPEPGLFVLLGTGLLALTLIRRRRRTAEQSLLAAGT